MKNERHVAEGALMYVVLPLWAAAGLGDYFCHRRTKIESTSGTHESLTHSLMMTSVGVPSALALLFEINAYTLAVGAVATLVHEAVVLWDVAYAAGRREMSPTEQHFHSFLEVLPLASLLLLATSRPEQAAALIGGKRPPDAFRLRPKRDPIARASLAAVFVGMGLFVGLPYVEEFVRCLRTDHTIAPHPKPQPPPSAPARRRVNGERRDATPSRP